jgi:hypothetical protein
MDATARCFGETEVGLCRDTTRTKGYPKNKETTKRGQSAVPEQRLFTGPLFSAFTTLLWESRTTAKWERTNRERPYDRNSKMAL